MDSSVFARYFACVVFFVLLIFPMGSRLLAQAESEAASFVEISLEEQLYPTGLLSGLRVDFSVGARSSANVRLGYNLVRHRDLGVQDDEKGGGFGGSVGYRYHFNSDFRRWFAGIRADVWFNSVDWKNEVGAVDEERGTSDIIVFQPTAELGYIFALGDNGWHLTPAVSLGGEINVSTDGKEVGQGAILLLGLSIGKRFGR